MISKIYIILVFFTITRGGKTRDLAFPTFYTISWADLGIGQSGPAPSFDNQIMQIQPFLVLYLPLSPPLTNPASAPLYGGGKNAHSRNLPTLILTLYSNSYRHNRVEGKGQKIMSNKSKQYPP